MGYVLIAFMTASLVISAILGYYAGSVSSRRYLEKYRILLKVRDKFRKARNRYLVFEVVSLGSIDSKAIESSISSKFRSLYGDLLFSDSYYKLVYFDEKNKRGIIRIRHKYINNLIAVLGLIRRLDHQDALLIPIRTSGTIKRAKNYI